MSRAREIGDQLAPWMGLAGGGTAYALFHQIGSDGVFQDCAGASPMVVVLAGLLCLGATGLSGLLSWGVASSEVEAPARKVIATVSVLLAGLLAFATVMPMAAALIIPRCSA